MLIYHCHSPHPSNLSFAVGETVAQKGKATCPMPYCGSDVNPEIRLHIQSGDLSTVQKEKCINVNEDVFSIMHGGGVGNQVSRSDYQDTSWQDCYLVMSL